MKDKLKVLQNELDILQNEVGIKDKLLQQQHTQHAANIAERDQLRVELGRWGGVGGGRQGLLGGAGRHGVGRRGAGGGGAERRGFNGCWGSYQVPLR